MSSVRQPTTIKPRSKQAAEFYGQTFETENNKVNKPKEGLTENGKLLPGYYYAKGGIVTKAKSKK